MHTRFKTDLTQVTFSPTTCRLRIRGTEWLAQRAVLTGSEVLSVASVRFVCIGVDACVRLQLYNVGFVVEGELPARYAFRI